MGQQIRTRKHGTVQFQASSTQFITLTRGAIMRELVLKLKGQLTVAGASNTAAATLRGDEWAVVQKIELIANGTDVLRSFTGEQLRMLNLFQYQTPPCTTITIGDGATLNPTFETVLMLPLATPQLKRPFDTALDTRKLSDLRLAITWGSHLSINAAATGFTVNPTVDVWAQESSGYNGNFFVSRMAQQSVVVGAANTTQKVDQRVGPIFKGFYVNTQAAGGASDSTAMLNSVKVVSGPTVFFDMDKESVRQSCRLRREQTFFFERALNAGTGGNGRYQQSTSCNQDAWYQIDLCPDGMLSEAPDSFGLAEFSLVFDLAAACNLIIIPHEIFPVRNAAPSAPRRGRVSA